MLIILNSMIRYAIAVVLQVSLASMLSVLKSKKKTKWTQTSVNGAPHLSASIFGNLKLAKSSQPLSCHEEDPGHWQ